jgi:hypothetical protein
MSVHEAPASLLDSIRALFSSHAKGLESCDASRRSYQWYSRLSILLRTHTLFPESMLLKGHPMAVLSGWAKEPSQSTRKCASPTASEELLLPLPFCPLMSFPSLDSPNWTSRPFLSSYGRRGSPLESFPSMEISHLLRTY